VNPLPIECQSMTPISGSCPSTDSPFASPYPVRVPSSSGPWLVPLVTGVEEEEKRETVNEVYSINSNDLEDLSTTPWMPMTGEMFLSDVK